MGRRLFQIYKDNIFIHKFEDLKLLRSSVSKKEILILSVNICVDLCPKNFYLAPLPKRTIFIVRKMIIKSIKDDMFLI